MLAYKKDFIEFMLDSGVLRFGEFKTKSGRLSPYFINTGLYRTGAQISRLGQFYAACLCADVPELSSSTLFGPAYKGIPLAVAAATSLYRDYGIDVPYVFNRKEAKDHGEGGVMIGATIGEGDNVVIIEDVMTAGTALRESMPLLTAAGAVVRHMLISVDRMERGIGDNAKSAVEQAHDDFGITVHALVTVRELIEYLTEKGETATVAKMNEYLDKYCAK